MVFTISCIGTSKDHSTHTQGRFNGFIDDEHSLLSYSTLHSTGTGTTVHGRSHHWEPKCVPLTDNHHGYSWDEFPISEGLERVVGYLGNTQHMHHNLACHTPFNCMHVPDYLITICTGSPGEEELQGPAEHVHVKHRLFHTCTVPVCCKVLRVCPCSPCMCMTHTECSHSTHYTYFDKSTIFFITVISAVTMSESGCREARRDEWSWLKWA